MRTAIPWPKFAVSHLHNLQLSRLFRLTRTLDANQQPTDTTSHTTWVDLLKATPRKQKEEDRAAELEYEIESIIIVTEGKGKIPNIKSSG